jgi:hypothetical protein
VIVKAQISEHDSSLYKAGLYPRDDDEAALLIDEVSLTAEEFMGKVVKISSLSETYRKQSSSVHKIYNYEFNATTAFYECTSNRFHRIRMPK